MGFAALNTAYTGLVSAQFGLDTTSHNVANARTEGYTRQRVDVTTRYPRRLPEGYVGNGVQVTDVVRARDRFLDDRVRTGQTVLGSMVANADLLHRVEQTLGEPDHGLSAELDSLFDAWEDLALQPDDRASRVTVLAALERVATRVRASSTDLDRLDTSTRENVGFEVTEVNDQLRTVAELNAAIEDAAATGRTPNDLMDQRDLVLDELARSIGADVVHDGTGPVRVSLDGMGLVDGVQAQPLSLDASGGQLRHANGSPVRAGGEVGGMLHFLATDLPGVRSDLDRFAGDLAAIFNTRHGAGFTDTAAPGGDLFSVTPGSEAASLQVTVTRPEELAASSVGTSPFPAFNGVNAQGLADLRGATLAAGGTVTLGQSYRSLVTDLGSDVASLQRAADAQDGLVAAAEISRTQQHGVSIDEEMVNLIEYQRSYQAASRVITSIDQALDTLINRTGVVGR